MDPSILAILQLVTGQGPMQRAQAQAPAAAPGPLVPQALARGTRPTRASDLPFGWMMSPEAIAKLPPIGSPTVSAPAPGPLPDASPVFDLGETPVPHAPNFLEAPPQIDIEGLRKSLGGAFASPGAIQFPAAPPRPKPEFADISPFVEAQKKAAQPIDRRRTQDEFSDRRFRAGLAGAASGAAGGDSIGEVLLGAGAGLLGALDQADESRREEDFDFREAQQRAEAQVAALEMEAAQYKAEIANATNEVDFANAQTAYATTLAQLQENQAAARELGEMRRERLAFDLDLAQLDVAQQTQLQGRDRANKEMIREYVDQLQALNAPRIVAQSEDGRIITLSKRDPATGKTTISQKPFGPLGEIQQMTELMASIGGIGAGEMQKQLLYSNIQKLAPQYLKRQMIVDILGSGRAEEVFGGSGGVFDPILTSTYEKALNEAEKTVKEQVAAGLIAPEEMQTRLMETIAMLLEDDLDEATLKRFAKLASPGTKTGLGFLGAP